MNLSILLAVFYLSSIRFLIFGVFLPKFGVLLGGKKILSTKLEWACADSAKPLNFNKKRNFVFYLMAEFIFSGILNPFMEASSKERGKKGTQFGLMMCKIRVKVKQLLSLSLLKTSCSIAPATLN